MKRREFIAAAAAAASIPTQSRAAVEVEVLRPPNQFDALLKDVEPGHDEFASEGEAFNSLRSLQGLLQKRTLPFAADLQGASPLPIRYAAVADDVFTAEYNKADHLIEEGLKRWLDSLGDVRAARFFVLPDDVVRYEIASKDRYRVGLWKQRWAGGKVAYFEPLEETVTVSAKPLFLDVTTHCLGETESFRGQLMRGVPNWRTRLDAASGIDVHGHNGVAVGDIDGDGFDEIYVCQPGGLPNRLYRNRGDCTFEDITDRAGVGVLDPTSSALFIDSRNSGRQDLVVLRPDGPLLFLNQGDGRFALKSGAFRFRSKPQGAFTGMAAADYDRDGRLDLYLCTYSFFRDGSQYRYPVPYHDAQNGPANFLFRNELSADGTGSFVDVTNSAGLDHNNNRFSFAPAWCDYNGDGWPDLFVANDFGRKNLYRNQGGVFRDVAAEAGVEDIGAGMSASWFDYDGDGLPDLYVSNMWSDAGQRVVSNKNFGPARSAPEAWRRHVKGNSLYRNRGDGTFEETGSAEGVEMGRWAWASDGIDFDNDGSPEIVIASGMLTNALQTDLESFFWRKVAARSPASAMSEPAYENGWNALSQAAHEDYSEAGHQPNVFYVRRGKKFYDFSGVSGLDIAEDSRAFSVTDLDGSGSLDLILKSRLGPQLRIKRNNSSAMRRSIAFRFRGTRSNRDGIGVRVEVDGQTKFLAAGSGYLSQHTKTMYFGLGEASVAHVVRVVWPSGTKQEFEGLKAGFVYEIQEGLDHLKPSPFRVRQELPAGEFSGENGQQLRDTWFLNPLPLPEPGPGAGFLRLTELSKERAALYAVFHRYLFDKRADLSLPVWFLVDDSNRAHKIYFSPPDPGDLKLMGSPDRARLALPYAGKYYTTPERNYGALGAGFFAAGFREEALRYLELAPQTNYQVLFTIGQVHLQAGRWDRARIYYQRGLALAPDSGDGWNNLAAVELGAGDFRKAVDYASRALKIRPDNTSTLINMGQAQAGLGDLLAAEKTLQRAANLNSGNPAAENQLGELLVRANRNEEAKAWFKRAISVRRDYAPAINNLGALFLRTGQPQDAIAAFQYGISVAPAEQAFYLNLANLYISLSDYTAARATLERLLARDPGNDRAKQLMRVIEAR